MRKTYEFITKIDPTPELLKEATYHGMMKLKEERDHASARLCGEFHSEQMEKRCISGESEEI